MPVSSPKTPIQGASSKGSSAFQKVPTAKTSMKEGDVFKGAPLPEMPKKKKAQEQQDQDTSQSTQSITDDVIGAAAVASPLGSAAKLLAAKPASLEETANKAAREASAKGLQVAWEAVEPTFGLSLLWIAFHLIMSIFFPNKWCQLGEEWGGSPTGILHWMELIGFLSVFILWLMAIAAIFIIIIMLASCAASPGQCIMEAWSTYFHSATSTATP